MLLKVYKSRVWILLFMFMPFIGNAQIDDLPEGWDINFHPNSATYAIPTNVAFNGVDALAPGDWIGAFYMDNDVMECGGAVQWDGTNNLGLVVFGNDTLVAPDKTGFSEGEPIHWMFYRTADECVKAYDAEGAEFNWMNQVLTAVASFGVCEVCIDINLSSGFQFISSNVVPANLNFKTIMTDVLDNLNFARNQNGQQLFKAGPNWIDQIVTWDNTHGYLVKMNAPDMLRICGTEMADPFTPIDLGVGFKFISFLPAAPMNAQVALGSILDNLQFARNSAGQQLFKAGPNWINQIVDMNPGEGYLVKMNGADQLIYPATDALPVKSEKIQTSGNRTGHFQFAGGDPTNIWSVFLNSCTINGVDVEVGDELAMFDGDLMVGQWTITGPIVPWYQTLSVYKILNDGPGYTPGNPFTIKFWDESAQVEVETYEYELTDPYGGNYIGDVFPTVDNEFSLIDLEFFSPVQQYSVSTTANPIEGGLTAGDGMYDENSDATVTATANDGYLFVDWTVDGGQVSTEAEYTFTVTGDVALVANFEMEAGPAPTLLSAVGGDASVELVWEAMAEPETVSANKITKSRTGHFQFAGGDPTNIWSVFLNSVTVGGVDAEVGDELAMFDGDLMVGQWTITGPIVPWYQTLSVYKILNDGPGYTPGNPFIIKFWDESAQEEFVDYTYELTDPYGGNYIGDVFPAVDNEFSLIDLEFFGDDPPTFNLYQDGLLVEEGLEGNTFTVVGLDCETEYCFSVTQILEGDDESGFSNILCATTTNSCCEDVVINLFPEAPANVCMGEEVVINFDAVEVLNAASVVWSVDPVEAGSFEGTTFTLNTAYVGFVTVSVFGEATPPCANAYVSLTFEVFALPVVECPADFAVCVDAVAFALDGATPAGGVYSGVGVDAGMFDPAVAGVGDVEVTYTYSDDNGCSNTCLFTITVNALPVVECPADFAVCIDAEPWDLYGATPEGGFYSGVGVDMGMFDPAVAGAGTFEITYAYEDANMCVNFCTFNITVNPLPVVECPPTFDTVCQESAYIDFELIANGEYTNEDGEVVTGFAPTEEGFFQFELTVTENGCSTSCYFAIIVTPLPVVDCPEFDAVCEGSDYITFEEVTNGVYTNGLAEVVTGFDPDMAGIYNLTLTVTEYGCSASCNFSIVVNELPVVTCPEDMSILLENLPYTLDGATPAGGTYEGEGVVDGVFSVDMIGDYDITYTYQDENSCENTCMFTITVVEGECINPPTAFAGDDAAVCANEVYELAGAATFYSSVMWTTFGDGMFDDAMALNPTYTPGLMDLMNGTVELCLSVQPSDILCDPAMDCMLLSFNELPYVDFVLSANEICLDETLYVTATGPEGGAYPYTITGTFNGEPVDGIMESMTEELELVAPAPGTYVAVLTGIVDANGCAVELNEEFVVVVNPLPYITLALDASEICLGESVTGTITGPADGFYPYTVVYTLNGEEMTGMVDITPLVVPLTPDVAGLYTLEVVSVVDAKGCMAMEVEGVELMVHELPVAECPAYDAVCEGSDMIVFDEVEDGVYTDGEGMDVLGFDPMMAGTYMFTLTVTNEFGCSDFCEFEIVVNPLPYITLALDDDEICLGETVMGTITGPADGFYPYTVVYTLNDVEMTGMIDGTPLDVPLTPDMAGLYTLEVVSVVDANGCVAMAVDGLELTVLPLTEITMQPSGVAVEFGGPAEFTVEAVNATGYQWYHGVMPIEGATDASYAIASVVVEDGGDYSVMVMGDCGDVMSGAVMLDVLPWTQPIYFGGSVSSMSTYLELTEDYDNLTEIMAPIIANVSVVSFKNPVQSWAPVNGSFMFNEEKGAKVVLSGGVPVTIQVEGYPLLGDEITLPAGNNYMPVWSQNTVDADQLFTPIISDINYVASIDGQGYWWPQYNFFTLENIVPGRSYFISLKNASTLDFGLPAVDAAIGYTDVPRNVTSWSDATLTATQHHIVITADALSQLQSGDVIGAFNEYGQMTGMVEITDTYENTVLRTFGDNPLTERTEGFVEGDVMTIKVWRNGEEMIVQATFDEKMSNTNIFAEDGTSAITSLKLGVTSINDFTSNLTASLYPNPATDLVNIATNFEISNVKVVNYVGQVVFEQDVNQMNFQINTSNYGSGMYFVQIENQDGVVITKRLTVK